MNDEKMVLMCVKPGEEYIDSEMEIWKPVTFSSEDGYCNRCNQKFDETSGYICDGTNELVCENCVADYVPSEVFHGFDAYQVLHELLSRFAKALIECELEFEKHLPEKGESWLQDGTDQLFTNVQRVAAKLLWMADSRNAQLDESIDLILSAMMLAERYIRDNGKDKDDIPF